MTCLDDLGYYRYNKTNKGVYTMKNIKDRLTSKKFNFDKLVIIALAINSITMVGQGIEFGETDRVYAQQEEVNHQEVEEVPILIEDTEEGLEGSILTIKSSGVKEEGTEGLVGNEKEEVLESEEGYNLHINGLETEQEEFIRTIVPYAVDVAREYNVYPSIIVAQSILESDWGRSPLAVNANNLFGIKGAYNGDFVWHETKEDDGTGYQYNVTDRFAKYPSYKESVENNAKLIRNGLTWDSNFYSGAWVENTNNYQEATMALTGTYATDINYNQKVNRVIEEYNLNSLDK